MKHELTPSILEDLKRKGFKYVSVNAFARNKRPDPAGAYYFVLEPIEDLPDDLNKKGIYEPLESPLLMEWARYPRHGAQIFVAVH